MVFTPQSSKGEHNMKNHKSSGLTLTPLAIIIAVAAVVLGVELLFMVLLHEILTPMFKLPGLIWGLIDAVMLAAAVAKVQGSKP